MPPSALEEGVRTSWEGNGGGDIVVRDAVEVDADDEGSYCAAAASVEKDSLREGPLGRKEDAVAAMRFVCSGQRAPLARTKL